MKDKAELRVRYPGLTIEFNRNGSPRYRVRVESAAKRKISLDIGPEHPLFIEAYYSARIGEKTSFADQFTPIVAATGDLQGMIRSMLNGAKRRSTSAGVKFDLRKSDIIKMINSQEGRCILSGVKFDLTATPTRRRPFAPSLDRIIAKGDYTVGNVRLVSTIANIARGDWGDAVLREMAEGISAKSVPHPSKGVPQRPTEH